MKKLSLDDLRAMAAQLDGSFSEEQLQRLLPLVQALCDGMALLDDVELDGLRPEPIFCADWDDADGPRE